MALIHCQAAVKVMCKTNQHKKICLGSNSLDLRNDVPCCVNVSAAQHNCSPKACHGKGRFPAIGYGLHHIDCVLPATVKPLFPHLPMPFVAPVINTVLPCRSCMLPRLLLRTREFLPDVQEKVPRSLLMYTA